MIALNTVVYNEAHRIVGMLESAALLCDEFVVVDQSSTDGTADIARDWGATVIPEKRWGYCEVSRPLAAEHSKSEWLLVLDGDELLVPEKVVLIEAAKNSGAAAKLGRIHYVDGARQHADQDDFQLRFFRKGTVEYGLSLHTRITTAKQVWPVREAILHEKSQEEWDIDDAQWRSILEA